MENRIESFADQLREENLSPNTINSYLGDIKDFLSFLKAKGVMLCPQVEKRHLDAFTEELTSRGMKKSTLYRKSTTVKKFFHFLMVRELIDDNPSQTLERPRVERKISHCLLRKDIDAMVAAIDPNHSAALRDRLIIEILYATGIKVSELIQLEIGDFDSNRGHLVIQGPPSPRTLGLEEDLIGLLEDYIGTLKIQGDASGLFVNQRGDKISRQSIWKVVKKYAHKADLSQEINPHSFRNAHVVGEILKGVPLREIMSNLGIQGSLDTAYYQQCLKREENKG
ncbi:MAG: hypothetical protein AVO33_10795 [delta proteobacterium ML8_F1]|nr:MAG: hypothetical protein AVO33_10795 [delta proteobacterium ML8_F1]